MGLWPWVWPETKNPWSLCFVSGWGAEGVAVRNLSSTSFLPGSGVEPNLRRVDPWALGAGWQSNQLLGGGTPGLMEPSRGRMRPEDRSPGTRKKTALVGGGTRGFCLPARLLH